MKVIRFLAKVVVWLYERKSKCGQPADKSEEQNEEDILSFGVDPEVAHHLAVMGCGPEFSDSSCGCCFYDSEPTDIT